VYAALAGEMMTCVFVFCAAVFAAVAGQMLTSVCVLSRVYFFIMLLYCFICEGVFAVLAGEIF